MGNHEFDHGIEGRITFTLIGYQSQRMSFI